VTCIAKVVAPDAAASLHGTQLLKGVSSHAAATKDGAMS
jgi:hypothetical protein